MPQMAEQQDQNMTAPPQDDTQSPLDTGGASTSRGELDDLDVRVRELAQRLSNTRYAHEVEFPDFHKLLALPDTASRDLVDECLAQLQAKELVVQGKSGWEFLKSNDTKEHALYEPLTKALNIICEVFSAAVLPVSPPDFDGTQHPRQYSHYYLVINTNKTRLQDHPTSLLCHPDLCLMVYKLGAAGERIWKHVILPIEVKSTKLREPHLQSGAHMMALLSSQDCRLFSYSMTIKYPKFTFYLWDRSGFLSSQTSDLSTEEGVIQLVQVFGRFSQMTLEDHGFDPTTFSIHKTSRSATPLCHPPLQDPIYVRHKETDLFRLGERITPMSGIFGKETRCWKATKCEISETGTILHHARAKFLIKESWLHDDLDDTHTSPSAQPSESESDDPFTTDVVLSEEWSDAGLEVQEGKPRHLLGDGGYEAGLYQYLAEKGPIPRLAGFHGGSKLKSTFQDVRRGNGPSKMLSRTQYRVILSTVGQQLRNASTPQQLLMALRDIVDCHEGLCRRNILHRDISDTNCLMDPETNQGFLTDLDHAIDMTRLKQDVARSRRHRTGTLPFMAVGLLLESVELHHWTHDYESIFWMLLWICAGSPAFGNGDLFPDTENKTVLQIFLAQKPGNTRVAKRVFLYAGPLSLRNDTHPYFRSLGNCLSDLKILFNHHRLSKHDSRKNSLTRTAFRDVLSKWIDKLEDVPFNSEAIATLRTHDDGRYHPPMATIVQYIQKSSTQATSTSKSSLFTSRSSASRAWAKRKTEQGVEDLSRKRTRGDDEK